MRDDGIIHKKETTAATPTAGLAPVERNATDLVLERRDEDRWEVTVATPRGLSWVRDLFCCPLRQSFNGAMCLDIMSADRLLKEAHIEGLTTEFIGLSGKDVY
ncbi:hypothetical protein HJB84_25020 [Rhizobium sp. NZLR1b]|uniref:hypothetical protein n=1 Tax=unclassified Rhizobium TaxID=2613769 RepID=UPI001C830DA5|nr:MULTISPECIES: hypothetical protein [unclassified Rhizobium]MBX5173092.1 hypothetical protein [Rhizobium sp. NZLR1b]MBX5186240.1 hypothetical protein [Rhizobium sp. NZLR5]MBX5191906.1 hypothetical protein [Rhizobium sp. NZLR3b]